MNIILWNAPASLRELTQAMFCDVKKLWVITSEAKP